MKKIFLLLIILLLVGCSDKVDNKKEENDPIEIIEPKKNMYVKIEDSKISVISNYNDEIDIIFSLGKIGNNDIYNVSNIEKVLNIGDIPNSDFTNKETFYHPMGTTDWFGPYIVFAKNNIDGDSKNSHFTGGNHDYLNGAGGTDTGRTSEIVYKVNNEVVTSYEGYAETIDIYWTNYIQASNTKKEDGSGREVLKENYHITYNGNNIWNILNEIEFLEDVKVSRYYGLQAIINNWNQYIKYGDNEWVNMNTIQSTNKYENEVTLKRDNDYLKLTIDNTYGLGKRDYLTDNYGAFTQIYGSGGKVYYYLISNSDFNKNDIVSYKGTYEFIYTK